MPKGFTLPEGKKPYVIMVVGVNGVGKTTTIGKLAYQFEESRQKVYRGAADTFRAAAVEQLVIWSERVGGTHRASRTWARSPAPVAFDTLSSAKANDADVVIIDTAGRLHNKIKNSMNELTKIKNVMKKVIPDAPHEILLVLDGSTAAERLRAGQAIYRRHRGERLGRDQAGRYRQGRCRDRYLLPFPYPREIYRAWRGNGGFTSIFRKREFVNSLFGE